MNELRCLLFRHAYRSLPHSHSHQLGDCKYWSAPDFLVQGCYNCGDYTYNIHLAKSLRGNAVQSRASIKVSSADSISCSMRGTQEVCFPSQTKVSSDDAAQHPCDHAISNHSSEGLTQSLFPPQPNVVSCPECLIAFWGLMHVSQSMTRLSSSFPDAPKRFQQRPFARKSDRERRRCCSIAPRTVQSCAFMHVSPNNRRRFT